MSRQSDYISESRQHVRALWDAYHNLRALQTEWDALNYSSTLPSGVGTNYGILPADVGAAVFDTTNAITNLLGSGHATNLAKLL